MKTNTQKLFLSVLIITSTLSSNLALAKRSCAPANQVIRSTGNSVEDYAAYLLKNKISLVTQMDVEYLEEFIFEYEKFPLSLRKELLSKGTRINLIQGNGVTEDRSWYGQANTVDNRLWKDVPGAGGVPGITPTRVVVNHLYDNHGSANLVLHEHAHTLDMLYETNVISSSKTWSNLLAENPESRTFLMEICGSYCANNLDEGFAELFAYYYACDESRVELEEEVPAVAKFFAELNSVNAFKNADSGEKIADNRSVGSQTSKPKKENSAPKINKEKIKEKFKEAKDGVLSIFKVFG